MHPIPAVPPETEQSAHRRERQEHKEQRDQAAQQAKTREPEEMHPVWHPIIWIGYRRRFTRGRLYIRSQAMGNPGIVGEDAQSDQRTEQYQPRYNSK